MGLWSRVLLILKAKSMAALDQAEDPREALDYADEQQHELLRKVKQGLIEIAISKRQLEQQVERLQARVPQLEQQARRALANGREDLARIALERKQTALAELVGLQAQAAEVGAEEQKLATAEQQLAARIEQFRLRRQALAARYSAAEAQVRVNEALSGVSADFADLGFALGRAEEKIDRMLARASAVDALLESGALTLPGGGTGDPVEREFAMLMDREAVERELAALRAETDLQQMWRALKDGS